MSLFKRGDEFEFPYKLVKVNPFPKMIGIIFCHPNSTLGEKLINYLERYHYRSSNHCNFYFAGYGRYWPLNSYPDTKNYNGPNGEIWNFSNSAYEKFRQDLANVADGWNYTGETEFLLITARTNKNGEGYLDYSNTLAFSMERMLKEKIQYVSLESFLEKLFAFTQNYQGSDPVSDFSDKEGWECVKEGVFSLVPKWFRERWNDANHVATRKFE